MTWSDEVAVQAFWRSYLATLPDPTAYQNKPYGVASFGDSAHLADELGALVASGVKTATCGSLWEYEAEGIPIPEPGMITVVVDGRGLPLCIIETLEAVVQPFDAVDRRFAWEEGEGDRTLEYWRKVHWDYFSRSLAAIGRPPSREMPLVCERFRLLYSG
jgi:uncharacterized protein YhfF